MRSEHAQGASGRSCRDAAARAATPGRPVQVEGLSFGPEGPRPGVGARLRGRVRGLIEDRHGAVMTEAVLMLPVMILIWGIILYIHTGFREAQGNIAAVRSEAWVHGFGACNSSATSPAEFADVGAFDGESSSGGGMDLGSALRFVSSTLFMLDEFKASRTRDVTRPTSLGGDTHTLRWELMMLCNEPTRPDQDPLWNMWTDLGFSAIGG